MVKGRSVELSLQKLYTYRMRGMRHAKVVAEELRRLGREEDLSMDHKVRIGVLKGNKPDWYVTDY